VKPSPTPEFLTNIYYNPFKGTGGGSSAFKSSNTEITSHYQRPGGHNQDITPAISSHHHHYTSARDKPFLDMTPDDIRTAIRTPTSPYTQDQAIEIISSSQFFKHKGNMRDIAAVIKPPELSDELVKAALPPQIAAVPQLSYPTQQLIQVF
jgi:hypothetical protein